MTHDSTGARTGELPQPGAVNWDIDDIPVKDDGNEAARSRRISAQHGALEMFIFMRRHCPHIESEERRNRAALRQQTTAAAIDAVLGALDRGTFSSCEAADRIARLERGRQL